MGEKWTPRYRKNGEVYKADQERAIAEGWPLHHESIVMDKLPGDQAPATARRHVPGQHRRARIARRQGG